MELFRRFPNFHPLPRQAQEILPPAERSNYPSFTPDFATLETVVIPLFRELDNKALSNQNLYRWMYVILIFGGAIATALAIVQLAFLNVKGWEIAGTVVATILALVTTILRTFKFHKKYLNARLAAERLRSEYFLFLGCLDQYAKDKDRVRNLKQRVLEIKTEEQDSGSAE